MFSDDIIGRVRDSVNIVDLVSGYVSLKKTGKNHTGLCPFHSEKTPSFSVNPDKQIFHCFGCGAGGDVFKFLELQEGLNFPEAVRKLADNAGIVLPVDGRSRTRDKKESEERAGLLKVVADAAAYYRKELEGPAGSTARSYLKKRGVNEQTIRDFGLGFARPEWDGLLRHLKQQGHTPTQIERAGLIVKRSEGEGHYDRFRGRIIFPIRDIAGKVIAFGGRVMGEELPKYLNSSETPLYSKSNTLYCLESAKEQGRKLGYFVIVEGYLDSLACHQYGVRNAVATLGTALTEGHLRLLRRFADKLMLIFDPDPAGVRASLRGFDLFVASGMKVNVVSLPDNDDPDTFLQKHGKDEFDRILRSSNKLMDFVLSQVMTIGPAAPIDERMDIAREVVSFIEKIPDGNVQRVYINKLIDGLDIDYAILHEEITRERKASIQNHENKIVNPPPKRKPPAEEILIHLMLRDEAVARNVVDQLAPEDFSEPLYQKAVRRMFELLKENRQFDMRGLLSEGDEELNSLISRYSVKELDYEDIEQHYKDCVNVIKQRNPEKQMKLIVKALKEAEEKGNTEEYKKLLETQQKLSRRPGRRIPGL